MQNRWFEGSTLRFDIMAALALLCAAGFGFGCSSTTNTQTPGQSGGATGTGGKSAGGATSTGGSSGTGGLAAGSSSATGGSASGGTSATGGAASGGTSATGGAASGGASATGGSASGGTSSTGGSASGGVSKTGGSASGGVSATGGGASGGASKTGGAASGGVGAGGSASGGSVSGGAGGSAGGAGGTSTQGGTTSNGGSTGATGGSATCAARVLSLSSNATGSAADTAYAHVEVDMKTDLPIGNSARTVEFWAFIKTTDWVGEKNELYYIGPATGATSASTFGLDFGTNAVTGSTPANHATLNPFTNGLNDDTDGDLGINSSTDQWVHVAMTWDQKALITYVNGAPKITINATTAIPVLKTAQSTLYIGCNPTNKNCFNGEFAEFSVWNVARSAADILADYKKPLVGNETGLVGYWKFDDASGATTAADSVTTAGHTAHPGTLTATTAAQDPTFITPTTPLPLVCP